MPPRFLTSTHDGRTFVINTQEPLFMVAEVLVFGPQETRRMETAKRAVAVDCIYEMEDGSHIYMWPLKKIETGAMVTKEPVDIAGVLKEMAEWYARYLMGHGHVGNEHVR